jgi:hypothetical protein
VPFAVSKMVHMALSCSRCSKIQIHIGRTAVSGMVLHSLEV